MACRSCLGSTNLAPQPGCASPLEHTDVSAADAKIDEAIQAVSIPNLAALFKAGKDAGLIKPVDGYGEAQQP